MQHCFYIEWCQTFLWRGTELEQIMMRYKYNLTVGTADFPHFLGLNFIVKNKIILEKHNDRVIRKMNFSSIISSSLDSLFSASASGYVRFILLNFTQAFTKQNSKSEASNRKRSSTLYVKCFVGRRNKLKYIP